MHDINKFERQNAARLREIYQSVRCPERTDLNYCGAVEGQPCRNMGVGMGTLASQRPRTEPHQSRKLVAIDCFLAAAGVSPPAPNPPAPAVVEGGKQTQIFDGAPAPWEKK